MNPEDFKYSEEHTWLSLEGDHVISGITDYAQQELGDIVFIELPESGEEVVKGESFGTIESVKAVSDLYAPVSGEIIEVNSALEDSPEIINERPYGDGWIISIKPSDTSEIEELLSAAEYEQFNNEESQ
ncbi:MAG: glycine cleavage system protein GcvH [bacterium]